MSIDFDKKNKTRIDLIKKEVSAVGLNSQKSQVALALDISGSMSGMLSSGIIQEAFDRILPLALQFDDDGKIDIWLFHDKSFNHGKPFTLKNRESFVQKEIVAKYQLGGTSYAPVINDISSKYKSSGKSGFFSKSDPAYIIFITDGDCGDHSAAEKAIINASSKGIFWQFIGVGGSSDGFSFLNKIDNMSGRTVDNANFFHINDLNRISDEELYKRMLNEFPSWLKEAKNKKIIS